MQKAKTAVESSDKWSGLQAYLDLVEANRETEPGVALDGAKSLVESVAKTVLADRGVTYATDDSFGKLVKMAVRSLPSFTVLETQDADTVVRMVGGLENVATSIGTLRNRHGIVGHGQDLHDERELDKRLANLAIDCADSVAGFLMGAHIAEPDGIKRLRYEDYADFNIRFDEQQEEIEIAGVIISPSKALFDQDIEAYKETMLDFGQKENLISALYESGTFATTHSVIRGLAKHEDFSDSQVKRLVEIGCTNSQVKWIMQDSDVRTFFSGLLQKHGGILTIDEVGTLTSLMGEKENPELTAEEIEEISKLGMIDEPVKKGEN